MSRHRLTNTIHLSLKCRNVPRQQLYVLFITTLTRTITQDDLLILLRSNYLLLIKLGLEGIFAISHKPCSTVRPAPVFSKTRPRGRPSVFFFAFRKLLDILSKIMLLFLEPFLFPSEKNYCYREFFTVRVKMPKI